MERRSRAPQGIAGRILKALTRISEGTIELEGLGLLMRKYRENRGVSQFRMAADLELSAQHLCDIEFGRRMATPPTLEKLERLLINQKEKQQWKKKKTQKNQPPEKTTSESCAT